MFNKIIVPLDGSHTAQCALPAAVCMATTFNSEVNLVHVLCRKETETSAQIDPLFWHMRKAESELYLAAVARALAKHNLQASIAMLEGEAPARIVAHATQQDADLVVLSSHGDTGLSGWNVSSVALKVLTRVHRSILLMRAFQTPPPTLPPAAADIAPCQLTNLLVALDGSKRAESVLPIADKLALDQNGTVWLAHVATPAAVAPPFHTQTVDTKPLENSMTHYINTAVDYLHHVQEQMACRTETAVLRGGNVISALNQFAHQKEIDLMLFSAHGHSNTKYAYGSIVTSAIVHGGVSLLIFQDLPPDEIEPTHAEAASGQQDATHSARSKKHAQPAYWNP